MKRIFALFAAFFALSLLLRAQEQPPLEHALLSVPAPSRTVTLSPDNLATPVRKSPTLAVVYSLLLPGMGELYADGFDNGRYSLGAEAALWLTYISFRQYGSWLQSDSRLYAVHHAGALPDGKDDQFYVNIGNFSNVYDYNDKKLRDRNISEVYDPAQGYSWNWDSDQDRQNFRSMRISTDKVFNNSRFVLGAIVVNHILSALNAARLTRNFNRNSEEALGSWRVEPNQLYVIGQTDGLRLTYTRSF